MTAPTELETLRISYVTERSALRSLLAKPVFNKLVRDPLDAAGILEVIDDPRQWIEVAPMPATTASGSVTFTSTSTDAIYVPPGTRLLHGTSGQAYRTLEAVQLPRAPRFRPPSTPRSASARIEAEEAGSASKALPGTITVLDPPIADVTATNPGALIADDAESIVELRTRILNSDRYSTLARAARRPDTTLIGANRARAVGNTIYVAGPAGGITDVDDLAILRRAIYARSPAVAATDTAINIAYTLSVDDATSPPTNDIEDTIEERLAEHFATIPIGGLVRRDVIDTVIRTALGMRIIDFSRPVVAPNLVSLTLAAPAANVQLGATAVPVVGTVTPSITRV